MSVIRFMKKDLSRSFVHINSIKNGLLMKVRRIIESPMEIDTMKILINLIGISVQKLK